MASLFILIGSLVLLILGVAVFKVHPIPALLLVGLLLGLAMGGSVDSVTESLLSGFGNTLKWIGLVILFGTLLGEILAETGGADLIADSIIKLFGTKYLPLGMAIIGFLVGIPVFVDVAYLTLLPTVAVLSKKSGYSVLVLGLSLAMSLGVAHALIPPTPGPLAVAALLEIDVGKVIPMNILVALAAIAGGLIWIRFNRRSLRISDVTANYAIEGERKVIHGSKKSLPFLALLSPLVMMALGNLIPLENAAVDFIKNPVWALMIGVAFALPLIKGNNFAKTLNDFFQTSGAKSATIILITGVGGAFGQVIKDSHVVETLFIQTSGLESMGLAIPFLLSLLFTSVTGSITVSLITTSSIVAPLVTLGVLGPELTAAAIGAGSLGVIHVNSSFFWLFKEVHKVSTLNLLKSFSVLTGILALAAGTMVMVLYFVYGA